MNAEDDDTPLAGFSLVNLSFHEIEGETPHSRDDFFVLRNGQETGLLTNFLSERVCVDVRRWSERRIRRFERLKRPAAVVNSANDTGVPLDFPA